MQKILATFITCILGSPQAQALGAFAALSAVSLEWLHLPLSAILWAALGGVMALGMSAPPQSPPSRAQALINIGMTLCSVPAAALFGCAFAEYAHIDTDSLQTSCLCFGGGLTLHKALPAIVEKFGTKIVQAIDKLFAKLGLS